MKHSLRFRVAAWFAASVLVVTLVFSVVTILHLRHELKIEQWERAHPENPEFILHGNYSDEEIHDIAGHILRSSLLLVVPVVGAALAIGWRLARRSMRPMTEINEQLRTIDARRLGTRVKTADADAEVEAVTHNLNGLLERLETSYRDASEFSARVAHELRTPLTLMRLQLEESAATIDPELAEALQDELARLESYVEQCLLIARAERGQLEVRHERLDLVELVGDVLEPFTLLAREQSREIEWEATPVPPVEATPWIVRQILHNLLANALQHGSGPIRITLDGDDGGVSLSIANAVRDTARGGTGFGHRIVEALVRAEGGPGYSVSTCEGTYRVLLRWTPEAGG